MPRKTADKGGKSPEAHFISTTFDFFSAVLKSIATEDLLRILWGVEVLLFAILVFMIWFGDITREQRFDLVLVIIASVVALFVFSAWRTSGQSSASATSKSDARAAPAAVHPELTEQARKFLSLLTQIRDANARIIDRGRAGSGSWARIQSDTYGHVCDVCHRRRLGTEPADIYFDTICAEPDVRTVCEQKWKLGEALDDYRKRLDRALPMPSDHDNLEILIRRSVTQPNWSPAELEKALAAPIDAARELLG